MLESAQTVTETVLTMHFGSMKEAEMTGRRWGIDNGNVVRDVNAETNECGFFL